MRSIQNKNKRRLKVKGQQDDSVGKGNCLQDDLSSISGDPIGELTPAICHLIFTHTHTLRNMHRNRKNKCIVFNYQKVMGKTHT